MLYFPGTIEGEFSFLSRFLCLLEIWIVKDDPVGVQARVWNDGALVVRANHPVRDHGVTKPGGAKWGHEKM